MAGMSERLSAPSALVRLSFLVQSIYAEAADRHGLTAAQAQLLCVVMLVPKGMTELAAMLRLEKSSLSGLVDRAEQRGLVMRLMEGGDRRATKVALTDAGRQLAGAFYSEAAERLEMIVRVLPVREEKRFTELAGRIVLAEIVPPLFEPHNSAEAGRA